jgi:hypothetical protein
MHTSLTSKEPHLEDLRHRVERPVVSRVALLGLASRSGSSAGIFQRSEHDSPRRVAVAPFSAPIRAQAELQDWGTPRLSPPGRGVCFSASALARKLRMTVIQVKTAFLKNGLHDCIRVARDSGIACGLSLSPQRTQRINICGSARRNEARDDGHQCHTAYGK